MDRPVSRRALVGLAALGALAGCQGRGPGAVGSSGLVTPGEPATAGHGTRTDAGGSVADETQAVGSAVLARRLASAWDARDRAAFVAALSPGETRRAEILFDTWVGFASVSVTAGGGGGADDGSVQVAWGLPGERAARVEEFSVRVVTDGVRLVPPSPQPVWWSHPLKVTTASGASLLTTAQVSDADRRAWVDAAVAATGRLGRAELQPWRDAWDGTLVVAIPADPWEFAQVAGVTAGVAGTGAVTLQARGQAARVLVNPDAVARLGSAERVGLLVHEGVHAVSGSSWRTPADPVARALAEGLAEAVACAEDPARRAANAVRVQDGPRGLPIIDPGAEPDPNAYARAQRVYEAAVGRWGRQTVHGWLDDWEHAAPPAREEFVRAG